MQQYDRLKTNSLELLTRVHLELATYTNCTYTADLKSILVKDLSCHNFDSKLVQ